MNYRNQWPAIDANFTTTSAFADFYLEDYNSGLGAIITSDRVGTIGLSNTYFGVQYAYQVQLTKKLSFRPGVQIAVNNRRIDFGELKFFDMIDPSTGNFTRPTGEIFNPDKNSKWYGDLNFGGLLYSSNAWLGVDRKSTRLNSSHT